ncbi:hypothetical protein [Aliirhizobium cellulosilyticum]|uniref:Uncharacterized protein n=1 Tax=Aliirhizobium cellulosilyticum TaxID=393664 RepID=A0A7W6TFA7_9HYPH|nr:hypothetical protein [Rhizobium cellulosilyticum]MBB4412441.1 hypothetical protein [Rhizobium cellulosilyticum]MBB4447073.1 hypothetical protein [Rhizobium cellulosilyticum]
MLFLNFLLAVVGYTTAKVTLPIISLGTVQVQTADSQEDGFNWLGFKRSADNGLLCHTSVAGCLGLIPWIALIIFGLWRSRAG